MSRFINKMTAYILVVFLSTTSAQAQSCAEDFYSSAYSKMTSAAHEDALQDAVLRLLEKNKFENVTADNYGNPISYLLVLERNQYLSNFGKGGAWRYSYRNMNDLMYLNDAFYGPENVTCSGTEHFTDMLSKSLDSKSAQVLKLLLLGYKKNEIEAELGLYRGEAGRVLRKTIIPAAEHLAGG